MAEETTDKPQTEVDTPELSPAEKTEAEYQRIKAANDKIAEELLRSEKLKAEVRLGGEAGGHVEPPKPVTPEEKKVTAAKEFFKGTALGDAIKQANE